MFVDMTLINPAAPNRRLRPVELIGSMAAFSALLAFVVRAGAFVGSKQAIVMTLSLKPLASRSSVWLLGLPKPTEDSIVSRWTSVNPSSSYFLCLLIQRRRSHSFCRSA
jgi:hypothetical protein